MRRTRLGLICACIVWLVVGLAWPASSWAQKGSKRRAPEGATVVGRATERGTAQSSEHGNARAVEKGKGQSSERAAGRREEGNGARGVVRVEERERWRDRDHYYVVVNDYYGRHGMPPGLAKKHKLPPGLRKQLRERGHLPPGLEKHWVVLPVELERTFPPLPPHYVRRVVDDDLLVIDVRANMVVSIMAGVFIRR